jgi:hypothetical protein
MKKYLFVNIRFPIEITPYGMQIHSDRFTVDLTDCNELPPINSSSSMDEEIQKIISKANEYMEKNESIETIHVNTHVESLHDSINTVSTYNDNDNNNDNDNDNDNNDNDNNDNTCENILEHNKSQEETQSPSKLDSTPRNEETDTLYILKKDIKHPKHVLKNQTFKKHKKRNNITYKIT